MKAKKKQEKKANNRAKFVEDDLLFGSDENLAFIVGFTSNGAPFGITHEEMRDLENEQKLSKINDDIELPF
jgi:hypothetical protein